MAISSQIQLWNDTRQVLPCKSIISPQKSNVIELHFAKTKLQLQSMENQCTLTVTALGKRNKCHRNCKGWDKWKNNYQFHSLTVQGKKKKLSFSSRRSAFIWAMRLIVSCNLSQCCPTQQALQLFDSRAINRGVISNRDASTKIPGATQRDATCIYSILA